MKLIFLKTSVILIGLAATILAIVGCEKQQTITNQSNVPLEIEQSINSFFSFKREVALGWENRSSLRLDGTFTDLDVKDAVLYKLMKVSEMGLMQSYSQDIIVQSLAHNSEEKIIVPVLEKAKQKIEEENGVFLSDYEDLFYFVFEFRNQQWVLTDVKLALLQDGFEKAVSYLIDYDVLEKNATLSDEQQFILDEYLLFKHYFNEEINEQEFINQIERLYERVQIENESSGVRQNIDRNDAVDYALDHAYSYNNDYANLGNTNIAGGDCSNFVSQCLYSGGWQYENPYNNSASCEVWWYKHSNDTWSNTWAVANGLYRYITYCNNYGSLRTVAQSHAGYISGADVLFFDQNNDNIKDHTMIVTRVRKYWWSSYRRVYVSGHTTNRRNYNIANYENANLSMIFARL